MFCAAGQTASDGGVSFSPPAPYSGFVGGYAVGSVRNGQNVLVEVAQLGTGSIRLVCVSPTGTPAGAGIDVTLISLLRLS